MLYNYSNANNGRIWLLWDGNVYQVDAIAQGVQYLHCNVLSGDKKVECCMIMIYGFNTVELRKNYGLISEQLQPRLLSHS